MTYNLKVLICYCALIIFFSLVALILYFKDKKLAVKGKERIKEKTLLFFGVFFGALGSLIGRVLAHHKTDKVYFSIVIYFSLFMEIVTAVVLGYLALTL